MVLGGVRVTVVLTLGEGEKDHHRRRVPGALESRGDVVFDILVFKTDIASFIPVHSHGARQEVSKHKVVVFNVNSFSKDGTVTDVGDFLPTRLSWTVVSAGQW